MRTESRRPGLLGEPGRLAAGGRPDRLWGAVAGGRSAAPGAAGTVRGLGAPEAGAFARALPVESDVEVVDVAERDVRVPRALTDVVALHERVQGAPDPAVPDDLLHAHAAGQREAAPARVGGEQQAQQRRAGAPADGGAGVQVPVDGAAFGVQ